MASTAGQQGQEVVGAAAQQAREVTATVKEQANQLTQELSGQGRALYQETRQQLEAQAETQTQHLTEALYRWSFETQALVDGRPEEAGTVGRYAQECAQKLQDVASGIEARGVDGMLEDLQLFARRRPGAFLLGAAVIGFGGGRLVRSAKAGADDGPGADGLRAQPQLAAPPTGRVRRSPVVAGQGRPTARAGAGAPRDARSLDGA